MPNSDERAGPTAATPQKSAAADAAAARLAAQFAQARKLCAANRLDDAGRLCRQMLATAPGHPQILLMLGEILSAQARHDAAIALLAPVVRDWPNAGSARFCLGNALHGAGRLDEAAQHLRRATELQPQFAGGYCNLGIVLQALGDRDGAIHAYERALLLQPNLAQARANLGHALIEAEKFGDAAFHLRAAAALDPDLADNHYFLGVALQKGGAVGEAVDCYRAAIARKPEFADAHFSLGSALTALDRVEEALPAYRQAVAIDPGSEVNRLGLGSTLRALGRFPEAIACFEKALEIKPDFGAAHRALTTCRQAIGDGAELERLARLLADPDGDRDSRGAAGLAMAKILDDTERFEEAFAAAAAGNALLREAQIAAGIGYDHDAFRTMNDKVAAIFTPEFVAATRDWGLASELPVFIVGYFRSGTTLVEQICASHSAVFGAGELSDIPQISAHLQHVVPSPQRWAPPLFRGYGERHLQRLAELAPGAARVLDKMPDNVYLLGLIATMFPGARVIFCHRDGRDAALSVFFQRFARNVPFATDLVDAGRRWHEAERIGSYWQRVLPLRLHHVQYETLVGDFESEARRLIDFLGLEWQPDCLEFYRTERAVRTASTWQVRQPLYHRAVGRWQHYRKHLRPLCAAIAIDDAAPTGARPGDIG